MTAISPDRRGRPIFSMSRGTKMRAPRTYEEMVAADRSAGMGGFAKVL